MLPEIAALDDVFTEALRSRIDGKTKPRGALGKLEAVALQLGRIQRTARPRAERAEALIFAADHGLADEGVSVFPQAVTRQMVGNFLAGGAAMNVFCRLNGIGLRVVDAGVAGGAFAEHSQLVSARVREGGAGNSLRGDAMTREEVYAAVETGRALAGEVARGGAQVFMAGEMGIGNSSAAALLTHVFTGVSLEACVGRGTGCDDVQLARKVDVLRAVRARHAEVSASDAWGVLAAMGGCELAMMAGAFIGAAEARLLIVVDGYIATAALLAAVALRPAVLEYCVFAHGSAEPGHRHALAALGAEPLLELSLRLGEGTGAALAWPLVRAAVAFLEEMAEFGEARVDGRVD